ncbi:MAG: hypothetical protein QOG67_1755 [Verrucomicrobiota bacterium]|jgi:hypothetical protein
MTTNIFSYSRITVFAALLLWIPAANGAGFTQIPLPDAAYTGSTTLIPIMGMDGDTTLTLSDAFLTVTFSALMQEFTVPTTWSNWGSPPTVETSTPRVLSPVDYLTTTSVTLLFSKPLSTFGLEAEPDALEGTFPVRLDFFNGATLLGTVSNDLTGFGAALFAASSMTPITSVTLTIEGNSEDPAGTDPGIAQIRYALAAPQSVPEGGPSTWLIVATVLALFTVHRFRYARN